MFEGMKKAAWAWCLAAAMVLVSRPEAVAADGLAQGMDFLTQEAAGMLLDVPAGRFGVLQFVEETGDPANPYRLNAETAGLGTYLYQLLTDSLQRQGRQSLSPARFCEILRQNQFKTDDFGRNDRLRALFGSELSAVVYGRMRRNGNVVTVGVSVVKLDQNQQVAHYPQGRNITVSMDGNMYALCAMNGMLQIEPGLPPGAPGAPMTIVAPLQPQAPTPPAQPYNLEVLVDGAALPCYRNANGNFYIPAILDKAYQVRLTNNTGVQAAAALLIDGLSAIGKERALPQRGVHFTSQPGVEAPADVYKYVVPANGSLIVKGWQIDERIAREFVFVAAEKSVAGEKDFWDYIGNISVSFFPILSVNQPPPTTITRGTEKGMVGTGQGQAILNQTTVIQAYYDRNPAAVMGLYYEQQPAIIASNMTLVR
jgi:hypothetical protein